MQNAKPGNADTQPRRRVFQFSLGSLLLATTALCVWLGAQANAARRQRDIASAVERLGGQVHYDWQFGDDVDQLSDQEQPPGPAWLRRWIGDDFFQTAVSVTLWYLPFQGITDASLPVFEQFPKLNTLYIFDTAITPDGIARFRKARPKCHVINGFKE